MAKSNWGDGSVVEKEYIFFDTGKGCLVALFLYSAAVVVLGAVFILTPDFKWFHWLLSLVVFATVTHIIFDVDAKTKRKGK